MDSSGSLFIADTLNHRIRKVSPSGLITTVAGNGVAGFSGDNGPAISASLNFPYGLAADAGGNIFIADASNHRIRKLNTNGTITTVAGNGIRGFTGDGGSATVASLNSADGVAVDAGGNLYTVKWDDGDTPLEVPNLTLCVGGARLQFFEVHPGDIAFFDLLPVASYPIVVRAPIGLMRTIAWPAAS